MQPLAILFGAAFTAATAFSLGTILLRNFSSDPAVRFVTGAALLSSLVFAVCSLRLAYPATFLAIGAASILSARRDWRIPKRPKLTRWSILFLPFLVLYFFNSMAPEISYDGSRYHLALVGRYLRDHGFRYLDDTFYVALSQGVEMLFLFAYSFGKHSAAAMVHFTFLLALAWQVYRWNKVAGFLVFASPLVGVDGSSAYNDVALAAIAFTLFMVLDRWSESRSPRLLVAAGLLAGFAVSAKYTGIFILAAAALFVAWRSRRLRPIAIFAACSASQVLPWLFKNYLWFRNPFAPFLNHWFPNQLVTRSFEIDFRSNMATYGSYRIEELGPVFVLAPLALAALRWREGRALLLAATVSAIPYLANRSARFLIPAVSFVAIAMCLPLKKIPKVAIALAVLHAILSWPDVLKRYARPEAWHLAKVTFREALRIKPEPGFLESNLPYYGITRRLDELTPPGSTVFTDVAIPDAYTSRTVLVSYQSAANLLSRRLWFTAFVPEHAPVFRARFAFQSRALGGFRLVQTVRSAALWTIHELRAFDGSRELPRAAWRTSPDLAAALDNRPISLWMSGETLHPGQSIQVDFAAPENVDSIVVEMAPDQPEARMVLEAKDLRVEPRFEQVALPTNLRRLAMDELKRRGIDYMLAFDGHYGSDDLRARATEWGIREITEYKGARLYQLP